MIEETHLWTLAILGAWILLELGLYYKTPLRIRTNTHLRIAAFLTFTWIVVLLLSPIHSSDKGTAKKDMCLSMVKRYALSAALYSSDYNDCLPLKNQWADEIEPYTLERLEDIYPCPETKDSSYTYAWNE